MKARFDVFKLSLILANMLASDVKYDIGKKSGQGKVKKIGTNSHLIDGKGIGLDCSGFVRYVLYNSTMGALNLTGGSVSQRDALITKGFTHFNGSGAKSVESEYRQEAAKRDDQLRIGFRSTKSKLQPDGSRKKTQIGHVWLIINGKTFECTTKSGNNGPCSLNWDKRVKDADELFNLGNVPGFGSFHAGW